MRAFVLFLGLYTLVPAIAFAAPQADLRTLEQAWHRCIRDAYAHQPAGQSRAGNERNALDECQAQEDAYVAALLTERPRSVWARAWAIISEPMSGWIGTIWR